ncbi:chemotaxis protein CheD [Halogranum rubrum]|uniref:Probable chemoreceptor glutamine deamidase CheD n=1 Tax=Halogranum salarium B-1 TaxID=1210908 RepID=J3JGQ2_9EURY|nr:chemotaxis protein CheD [Halogranum salarium]EJN60291.1 hypothetical protein HSB1_08940 [Halogranum salarium B-1]
MSRNTPPRTRVGIADYAVTTTSGVLSTSGLGSCLCIVLVDESTTVAGLLHAMLPEATPEHTSPAKFVDTGIEAMLTAMREAGATPTGVTAKIVGGSTMLELTSTDGSIGERNVDATRTALGALGIPIVAEDVGGTHGRSVRFDVETGDLRVKTAYHGEQIL